MCDECVMERVGWIVHVVSVQRVCEKGERRLEKGDRRFEKGDKRFEKGDRRLEKGDRRHEKGDMRHEKGDIRNSDVWQDGSLSSNPENLELLI